MSSELNKYVMSEYGNGSKYLSFAQMAELASLLGLGTYKAKEFKGNDSLKTKLLVALKNAQFSGGGEISSSGNVFGNDNILLRAKKGEFILTQDMTKNFKQLVNNLPQLNNYNNLSQNIINSIKPHSGIGGGNYHIDSILKIENVEGDVGAGVERKIESMLSGLDIEKQLNKIVNRNK